MDKMISSRGLAIKNDTHYSPHSFVQILFAFALGNNFDYLLKKTVGKNYCTFFEGRNGLYHVLMYLKQNFHSRRILVPEGICLAVKLASKRAHYSIIYYRRRPKGVKRNDVLLITDSSIRLPDKAFTIQDNARNPIVPSRHFDFTLYSFGNGKPLSSGGGGVVVVNNERFYDFLEIRRSLRKPSAYVEMSMYLKSLFWKLTTPEIIRKYGKKALHTVDNSYGQTSSIKVTNLNLSMCSVSKKLASTILRMPV